jgi:TRAP-type C4-dicarboxylate transport system permease small subunit
MSLPNAPSVMEKGIAAVCQLVLWITSIVIFLILTANTLLRYSTGASLQWANEVPEMLFPWLVMAGVVLAALHGSHIATTFLMESLPARARRVLGVAGWLAVSGLYLALSKATYSLLEIVHDEKSPILQVPSSITYGCVMFAMLLLALLALQSAWRCFKYGTDAAPVHVDAPSTAQG